jgi:hypothetical protein
MTVTRNAQVDQRTRPVREHIYRVPVVRELPARPPDPVGAQWMW